MMEIGEPGINLLGGQKACVALAKAMYAKDTCLLILDNPLLAVDSHVGEHLAVVTSCHMVLCPPSTTMQSFNPTAAG
jgi:ABC-type protease/lipase transport system fused ATPase/permease subunit